LVSAQEIVRLKFVPADENVFLDVRANDASPVRRLAASVLDRWTRPNNFKTLVNKINMK
jgi:tRNA threonylcarbamoyladenosine modification (KEOPS) complex  Pcc1 subunit